MPLLRVDRGDRQGEVIPLNSDKIVLGRSPECDEVISSHDAVSRWHAQIVRIKDRLCLEDLESRNHTFLNGDELIPNTPRELEPNDTIIICDFHATYLETLDGGEESPSTVEAFLSSSSDHSLVTQPAAKLAALLEITAKLSETLQLDAQLPQVADELLRLFPQADRCFLILAEEGTTNLIPKIVKPRGNIDPTTQRFSKTIVRQCLQTADSILLCEGDMNSRKANPTDSVVSSNMRSVMCVPLQRAEGEPFGVIQLDTQDAAKKFTPDDLKLLWGVAHQASNAMENARYHQQSLTQERIKNDLERARQAEIYQLNLERERVENELMIARQVQLNFLPKRMPDVPGYEFHPYYEAALEVGGDYYDFIHLPDHRLAITLGDVAGKGMPAALLMARLSSESRSCLLTERHPTAAMARLNDQIHPFTSPVDRYVTFVAAILDPATHTVTLVNAGHPTPLLYRYADHQFHEAIPADDDGQSLGIDLGTRYRSYQLNLDPGDSLLLFSDGVTDARGAAKRFDLEGIYNLLDQGAPDSPRALGQRLVEAVQRHAVGGPQFDDITLICFGRPATMAL